MTAHARQFWDTLHEPTSYTRVKRWLFHGHLGLVFLLLIVASVNVMLRLHVVPLTITSDTIEYVETAAFLAGEGSEVYGHRLLKPVAPVLMNQITAFTDVSRYVALEYLSIIFYLLLAVLIYYFLHLFLRRRSEAFIGALIYIGTYPMLMYGLDLYTETGAWFFHLLGLYFAVRYYKTPSVRYAILCALTVAIGFLWKEYAALAGLALGIFILIANTTWQQKIAHALAAALVGLPLLIGWQWHVYDTYQYTYLDWFKVGHGEPDETSQFSLFYMAKSAFALLLLGWIFVLCGTLKWHTFSKHDRIAGIVVGVTSLGFLAWGYVSSRLYFVMAPILAVLAGRGSATLSSQTLRMFATFAVLFTTFLWLVVANTPEVRAWLQSL